MNWKEAFIAQAYSDLAMFERLNSTDCEYAHRLHYLQMFSEKLAKGMLTGSDGEPPKMSHVMLVKMLQNLKGRPDIRASLGYSKALVFKSFIDSLLESARHVEALAPSVAGFDMANPEYPWRDRLTGVVNVPCEYDFTEFDPKSPRIQKLTGLLRRLMRMAT